MLETISHSDQAEVLKSQQADLTSWVREILNATWPHQVRIAPV